MKTIQWDFKKKNKNKNNEVNTAENKHFQNIFKKLI